MLEMMWSKGNTPPLLVGVKMCAVTLEIYMVISQEIGINLPQDPAKQILDMYLEDFQSYHKNMLICNSQNLKTT